MNSPTDEGMGRRRMAIAGATGYAGQELVRLLVRHPDVELVAAMASSASTGRDLPALRHVWQGTIEPLEIGRLTSGLDAVFLALPNSLHAEFALRAARAGVHVLCEKPLADHSADCAAILDTCAQSRVKLMVAYRLHFDLANLRAVELANQGKLGETRIFASTFTMQVKPGNVRLERDLGGGPLFDIGIYCINASRARSDSCTTRRGDDGTRRRARCRTESCTGSLNA